MAVQVRFTDQWEVRLTAPSYAVVIDMTRSDIFVNDEPLIGQNEKFIVHRLQNRMMIKIGMVLIRVGDTVDVMCLTTRGGSHRLPSKDNSPTSHKSACT
ncbi:hypothetical protein E2C01_065047 [Portunus trituberculatus]|uniref:FHA domain-containing protein n=1 Tax=Portunus trituberculatus TaxID=210409 RepID=A0A5B7HQ15_PORTR|nr:hypothetical protein [Portunus trituberculatus]